MYIWRGQVCYTQIFVILYSEQKGDYLYKSFSTSRQTPLLLLNSRGWERKRRKNVMEKTAHDKGRMDSYWSEATKIYYDTKTKTKNLFHLKNSIWRKKWAFTLSWSS